MTEVAPLIGVNLTQWRPEFPLHKFVFSSAQTSTVISCLQSLSCLHGYIRCHQIYKLLQSDVTTAHFTSPYYGSAGRLSSCLVAEEEHLIGELVDWRTQSETGCSRRFIWSDDYFPGIKFVYGSVNHLARTK